MTLKALALNCTLKTGSEKSSTDRLLEEVLEALRECDVEGEILRVILWRASFSKNADF